MAHAVNKSRSGYFVYAHRVIRVITLTVTACLLAHIVIVIIMTFYFKSVSI